MFLVKQLGLLNNDIENNQLVYVEIGNILSYQKIICGGL